MTDLVFPSEAPGRLPVVGRSETYPVRRIFCIGRNYVAHAAEMNNTVSEDAPWHFTKTPLHLRGSGTVLPYPPGTQDLHHEVELVAALGEAGVWGWATGLDMTRRDVQAAAKERRLPWDGAKDFEGSAVIGAITPAAEWDGPGDLRIALTVNGTVRQSAPLSDMVWDVPSCIAYLAGLYDLGPGDLVMTGTPAGVGAVVPGDRLHGTIEGLAPVDLELGPCR